MNPLPFTQVDAKEKRRRIQLYVTLLPHGSQRFSMHGPYDSALVQLGRSHGQWDDEARVWLFPRSVHDVVVVELVAYGVSLHDATTWLRLSEEGHVLTGKAENESVKASDVPSRSQEELF